jgi:trehalose 6-phosphate synthase/phosphatase
LYHSCARPGPAEQQLSTYDDDPHPPPSAALLSPDRSNVALPEVVDESGKWQLSPRRGHTAMVSGIRSLCDTHEQVVLAWTGDIEVGNSPPGVATVHRDTVKVSNLTQEDKASLEVAIGSYTAPEDVNIVNIDGAPKKKTTYVPVFLDDKIAHGHYEGYCKTSECTRSRDARKKSD